jgi:hypothetical protein
VFRHQDGLTSGSAVGQDAREGARAFAGKRAPHPARPLMPAISTAFPPQPVSDFQEQ